MSKELELKYGCNPNQKPAKIFTENCDNDRGVKLSEYMASTGKIYKNHLATIRSWAKRDSQKSQENKTYDHGNYQFAAGESL